MTKDYATYEEWLKFRRAGIGGSDIGAICGKSKWKSAVTVWMEKTNRIPDQEPSERMVIGKKIESFIESLYIEERTCIISNQNTLFVHPEYPHFIGSVDGIIECNDGRGNGVLEIKNVGTYSEKEWDDVETLPDNYYLQMQWYLFVTGLKWGSFAALIGGNRFVIHDVERDSVLIDSLAEIAGKFWNDYVLTDTMPPIDGSDATRDALITVQGEPVANSETPLPIEAREFIEQYNRAKGIIEHGEELKQQATNALLSYLGANETGVIDTFKIKHSVITSSRLDTKALSARYPLAASKYMKESTSHRITITTRK